MYIRVLTDLINSIGDQNTQTGVTNKQFGTLIRFSFCKLGLRIDFENSVFMPFEKFADIYF